MPRYYTPNVYFDEVIPPAAPEIPAGVPVFLGLVESKQSKGMHASDYAITSWQEYAHEFVMPGKNSYTACAIRAFFSNGGRRCFVYPLKDMSLLTLRKALATIEAWDGHDLICAPDIMLEQQKVTERQRLILDYCRKVKYCFAILDAINEPEMQKILQQRRELRSKDGALYYPWLRDSNGPEWSAGCVPPSGYIAGIYARCDNSRGVYKAPANEEIYGVVDLSVHIDRAWHDILYPNGVNCIRQFRGGGIRVMGASTLSPMPSLRFVNVRRLLMQVGRWCELNMSNLVFEENQSRLWERIERTLTAYLTDLFLSGALQGATAKQAFYVRCNESTNTADVRNDGRVVTEIGLAPMAPSEFIVMHIVHNSSDINILRTGS